MMTTTLLIASTLMAISPEEKDYRYWLRKQFVKLFEEGEYYYTGGEYKQQRFKYRLFVPRRLEPNQRYPLLLWLHGLCGSGWGNYKQLRNLETTVLRNCKYPEKYRSFRNIEQYRFFSLVPECPPDNRTWYRRRGNADMQSGKSDDMLEVAVEMLHKTMREHPIDPDRVYLSGLSSGGSGCWEAAMRYPELFAAVAPLASGGSDVSRADKLANIPIWVFHNYDDGMVPPEGDQHMVSAVQRAGGNVHLTLLDSKHHNCWEEAFQRCQAMDWMLAQRRGAICWTPPGYYPWKWWDIVLPATVFLGTVRLGWWRRICKVM